jgi:hypothetical protein
MNKPNTNTMTMIEQQCRDLADLRGQLREQFEARARAVRAAAAEFDDEIRDLQEQCSGVRAALLLQLGGSRELFVKPKTREFAGITVGFEKKRDTIAMPAEDILIERIGKMLPARQGEMLLDRRVRLIKEPFKKLGREILQRLGCSVVSGADAAIIRAGDDDIETLVNPSAGEPAVADNRAMMATMIPVKVLA